MPAAPELLMCPPTDSVGLMKGLELNSPRSARIPMRSVAALVSISVACCAALGLALYAAASAPPRAAAIQVALQMLVLWHLLHRVTDVRLRVAWNLLAPSSRPR